MIPVEVRSLTHDLTETTSLRGARARTLRFWAVHILRGRPRHDSSRSLPSQRVEGSRIRTKHARVCLASDETRQTRATHLRWPKAPQLRPPAAMDGTRPTSR
jgi:hypothetical protein